MTLLVSWAFVLVGGALAVVFYIRSRPTGAPPEQTPRPAQPRIVTTGSISSSQPQSNSAPPRTGEASSLRTEGTIRRLITINVLGTLLIETNPESLSTNGATVIPAAVHALRPLLARNEVFLVVRVVDDIGEIAVRGALEHAGVLGVGSERVASHRLLFCETMEGAVAIVRQLEPGVHIDTDSLTVSASYKSNFVRGSFNSLIGVVLVHILIKDLWVSPSAFKSFILFWCR